VKFTYATAGGEGEATDASGALMVPTGTAPQCTGPRPIVLYAHGTADQRAEDLSAITNTANPAYGTSTRIALVFAAQGYIVIAPNYAGYDISSLPYAPYLNGSQQSQDVIDGLTAGRQMLGLLNAPVSDNGKLYVTGYSQGGYVSMATLAALDSQGRPATAGAPMSGPYALLATGDEIFLGHPDFGGTVFLPMVLNSYAHLKQGSINPSQVFSTQYANAVSLFPGDVSAQAAMQQGLIPSTALFQSGSTGYSNLDALPEGLPLGPVGFDPSNYLISTAFREAYVNDVDANPDGAAPSNGSPPNFSTTAATLPASPQLLLRQDLKANDLRNYTPSMPLMMCGGLNDPEVYWAQGAAAMTATLNAKAPSDPNLRYATLDLDISAGTTGTFTTHGLTSAQNATMQAVATQAQQAFTTYQTGVATQLGTTVGLELYHTNERVFCTAAARTFFAQF
jgi:poly(3-hydroxybutyrate) depolymerase